MKWIVDTLTTPPRQHSFVVLHIHAAGDDEIVWQLNDTPTQTRQKDRSRPSEDAQEWTFFKSLDNLISVQCIFPQMSTPQSLSLPLQPAISTSSNQKMALKFLLNVTDS